MIERMQCLPRKLTRRGFGMGLGAAIGGFFTKPRKAFAAGSPFTLCLVPDPQYLDGNQGTCTGASAYNALIQWAITNRNLSVNGVALNVKGFLQVGDCGNTTNSPAQTVYVNAYALAEAASPKMFVARCCGNHDYGSIGGGTTDRTTLASSFVSGAWSPTNVAATYSGGMDLGNGDVAVFGGVYPDPTFTPSTANSYMRVSIQGAKIGIGTVEFGARSGVMNWMQGIQAAWPDHQWWITTHAYVNTSGARMIRTEGNGVNSYSLGAAPLSNSGDEMWNGSDASWPGMAWWPNLTGVFSGHVIGGFTTSPSPHWVWRRLASTSTGSKKQVVQQIFCDCQDNDQLQTYCGGVPGTLDGTTAAMHLMLLRFTPATSTMEGFLISTNNGKYIGVDNNDNTHGAVGGFGGTSPIQLFNVSMATPVSSGSHVLIG